VANQETPTTSTIMKARRTSGFSTATTITGSLAGTSYYTFNIEGVIDVITGGKLDPQFGFTGQPGAGSYIQQGTSFEIWPVSLTGSNTNVGSWS
jgi:hypothetical protein